MHIISWKHRSSHHQVWWNFNQFCPSSQAALINAAKATAPDAILQIHLQATDAPTEKNVVLFILTL